MFNLEGLQSKFHFLMTVFFTEIDWKLNLNREDGLVCPFIALAFNFLTRLKVTSSL